MNFRSALSFAALTVLLAGCVAQPPTPVDGQPVQGSVSAMPSAGGMLVYRVKDAETGTTCYVSSGYKSGGISCLPRPAIDRGYSP